MAHWFKSTSLVNTFINFLAVCDMFDSKTLNAYGSLLNKNDEKQKGNVSNGILGAMQSEKAMAAIQFANQQVAEIRSLATSGPLTFQVLSLIGGLAMTVQSVFGSFGKFLSFSPMQALIEGEF